ncbi:hypothetical protein LTR56_022416 [Elasticomyces elasticus]|nr:hypothetical protein LTR56_022416 [Elasticomyces elasticus]KAK3633022.1 hypothetical protein LTR22_020340 [Elasticomyces elasticus]KAK4932718.1 hypothetical protein LTR49_001142 [Elasticomyces elasticus]KAK5769741.1 hypothetical protein LTS12_000191 [Elasticomyces elasticus]
MPVTRSQTGQTASTGKYASSEVPDAVATTIGEGTASKSKASKRPRHRDEGPQEPPRFTVDLSLQPEQRYAEVSSALKSELVGLTGLFDEVMGDIIPWLPLRWAHLLCWLFLRGVHNKEEHAEIKGISKATGVPLYLIVCFNVLLDLLMGCSSGGATVSDGDGGQKMLHFRTLDWDMPALRRIVVMLDFVTESGGPVVASSITYAGFVGILTGVRKNLSLSLNFRPCRNENGKFWSDVKYAWHLLMVLLGYRSSIASVLRTFLLSGLMRHPVDGNCSRPPCYTDIVQSFAAGEGPNMPTSTACYLCFCSGIETTVVEKDRATAQVRSSSDFVVITNNDEESLSTYNARAEQESTRALDLAEIVGEARERKQCAEENWRRLRAEQITTNQSSRISNDLTNNTADVVTLVQQYPTTNEMTHFACVMDPQQGTIVWCRRWATPVGAGWIRNHTPKTSQ